MTRLPPLSTLFPYTTLFRSLNSVDYEKVLAFKDKIVSRLHKGVQGLVKARKIDYIEGFGRLTGPKTVTVETESGNRELTGANIVLEIGRASCRAEANMTRLS